MTITASQGRAGPGTAPSVSRPAVVFIGPSGSGKSSVVRALCRRRLLVVHPTWTTRPCRADEEEGSPEHRFVPDAVFDALGAGGFFAVTADAPFGLPFRYGLPAVRPSAHGPADGLILRAPFVARVAPWLPAHVIYQVEASPDRLAARLAERGTGRADTAARLGEAGGEVALGRRLAHRVFVNDGSLEDVVAAVARALVTDTGGAADGLGAVS